MKALILLIAPLACLASCKTPSASSRPPGSGETQFLAQRPADSPKPESKPIHKSYRSGGGGTLFGSGRSDGYYPSGAGRSYRSPRSGSSTSYHIGQHRYTDFDDGSSATSYKVGSTRYTDYSDGRTSTSYRVGSTEYTDFDDGTSVSSFRIGDTTYHDTSDGRSFTETKIGSTTYIDEN